MVVTYFPEGDLLSRLRRVQPQVAQVVVVDNGTTSEAANSLQEAESGMQVSVIRNCRNRGIATALNQGAQWAADREYQWILTLDQDTEVEADMVRSLGEVYRTSRCAEKVAIVGSNFKCSASSKPFYDFDASDGPTGVEIMTVITAGSLVSLAAFQRIGPFRDEFFIDCVDLEYCLRAGANGFRVVISRKPLMKHAIGRATEHRLPWKLTGTSNHSSLRHYYMTRNTVILAREYFRTQCKWVLATLWSRMKAILLVCIFEEGRLCKAKYSILGALDGIRMKTNRFA